MNREYLSSHPQQGSVLLEALIAVLIFSIGIIAVMGLQAVSMKNTADAKYRADAAFFANQIIGQMWGEAPANLDGYALNATGAACSTGASTGNANVNTWLGSTTAPGTVFYNLPGAATIMQQIIVAPAGTTLPKTVTVTICWKAPQQSVANRHTVVAQIGG